MENFVDIINLLVENSSLGFFFFFFLEEESHVGREAWLGATQRISRRSESLGVGKYPSHRPGCKDGISEASVLWFVVMSLSFLQRHP